MTGIEALEELTNMINREKHINSSWNAKINNLKEIVLKSLNRVEQLENKNQELKEEKDFAWEKSRENWEKYQKECKEVSELLSLIEKINEGLVRYDKAWEILINKIVNLETLIISDDLDTYHENLKDNLFYDKLTQEEYKLLKEILGEE